MVERANANRKCYKNIKMDAIHNKLEFRSKVGHIKFGCGILS